MTSVASGFKHSRFGKLACHEQPTQPSACCIYHNWAVARNICAYNNCPHNFTAVCHHEEICSTEICHTFVCPLSVSKSDSYLLWYEKVPCRLENDQCCKAEMADPLLLLHRIPQAGRKVKIPTCFILQLLNPCRHRYIHQDSRAEVDMGTAGTLSLSVSHRHALTMKFSLETVQPRFKDSFIESGQHMLQMPPLSLGKAFLANLVFGKALSGKPNELKTGKWCY